MLPTLVYPQETCSSALSTWKFSVLDWWGDSICKFLASQLCGNYPKLLRTSVIHWDMARAISCCIVILGWKATTCFKTICGKCKYFSHEFQSWKPFWGAPSWRRDFWPCLWGPGSLLSVASTAAPFDSRNSAASTLPVHAALWSGVRPQAVSQGASAAVAFGGRRLKRHTTWDDESCGQLSSTPVQPTNEQHFCLTRHLLQTVQKQKKHSQHTKQVSMHLPCKWPCLQWNNI